MKIDLDFGDHLELTPGMKLCLRLPPLTDEQLFDVCQRNEFWRFEREPNGELTAEIAKGGIDGIRIGKLNAQIAQWDETHEERLGIACGGNCGFFLPNGAMRAPIAAWLSAQQWHSLDREAREGFPRVCPYFVAEMRTLNLRMDELDAKMQEYRRCGAKLGLLFDPEERIVLVYRPDAEVEIMANPKNIHCEPEMPGFVLETDRIFNRF